MSFSSVEHMDHTLHHLLASFGEFSADDIDAGMKAMIPKTFQKDDYLIQAGTTCNWIGFVRSGIVRNYYISNKDEEVTYCLTFPHQFVTAYSSFLQNEPTFETIHAMTELDMLVIYKDAYRELIHSSTAWLRFSKFFAEQSYVIMENRLLALQMQSAEDRYKDLLAHNPEYIQQVPLKYLASYLGISQRHLSRLRSKKAF